MTNIEMGCSLVYQRIRQQRRSHDDSVGADDGFRNGPLRTKEYMEEMEQFIRKNNKMTLTIVLEVVMMAGSLHAA